MRLIYAPVAVRALRKAPPKVASDQRGKLQTVAADPLGQHPWAKRLTGQPGYRVRQGDWRTIYRLDFQADAMIVDTIAKRDEVYQ